LSKSSANLTGTKEVEHGETKVSNPALLKYPPPLPTLWFAAKAPSKATDSIKLLL
jgi:hypothetical protein